MAALTRRFYRSLLLNPKFSESPKPFFTSNIFSSSSRVDSDLDESAIHSDADPLPDSSSTQNSGQQRESFDRPLENGLDPGIFKVKLCPPFKLNILLAFLLYTVDKFVWHLMGVSLFFLFYLFLFF